MRCIPFILAFISSVFAEPLQFYTQTDKTVYYEGEHVTVHITTYNPNAEPVNLCFPSSLQATYLMDDTFDWATGKGFATVVTYVTIDGNSECTWDLTHGPIEIEQYPLSVGTHTVSGEIVGFGVSEPVEFKVIGIPDIPFEERYSGGDGSLENPCRISSAEELDRLGIFSEDWNNNFILMHDINMVDFNDNTFHIIGREGLPFTGVFDGNNHTIYNFKYKSRGIYFVGLFGSVNGKNALIKDVTVSEPNVYNGGLGVFTGSLVGSLSQGMINNCGVIKGNVTGAIYTGGLSGYNSGTIDKSFSSTSVNGEIYVGGLTGYNSRTIKNSYAAGTIEGQSIVGGITGYQYTAEIINCYSSCSSSDGYGIRGICQHNIFSKISNCYYLSQGDVSNQNPLNGTPLTDAQMRRQESFSGWDFVEVWNIGENQTHPYLRLNPAVDINNDGIVNFYDFAIMALHWLEDRR